MSHTNIVYESELSIAEHRYKVYVQPWHVQLDKFNIKTVYNLP